jgi:YidC/Oxa1 family membrane protein insertase
MLESIDKNLAGVVDFGFFGFIGHYILKIMVWFYSIVGNWGVSIILLTLLVRIVVLPFMIMSFRSMKSMQVIQPKLKELREKYKDDKQKLNEAMMRMYKEEKINPLGGCLPILVQIPVFIALYWMLLESVEMRQAPFMLWIQDLSSPDPFFVLPILMGVTMLIQHRLNPTPLDPIQARVMMVLPIAFTFFFIFFPAGLVLYWVVNNVLSIAQQYYITRYVVKA